MIVNGTTIPNNIPVTIRVITEDAYKPDMSNTTSATIGAKEKSRVVLFSNIDRMRVPLSG